MTTNMSDDEKAVHLEQTLTTLRQIVGILTKDRTPEQCLVVGTAFISEGERIMRILCGDQYVAEMYYRAADESVLIMSRQESAPTAPKQNG